MECRAKVLDYFQQHQRGWLLSLLATIILIYVPFLGNAFFFDDLNFFSGNIPNSFAHSDFNFSLRWFPYASLAWTAAIFSDAVPHFFHLGNMLLHAANVILLFFLLQRLITLVSPLDKKHRDWAVWLGTVFFACNPVAVYAVGYVIQRSILMATCFTLAMQLAYLNGLLSNQKLRQIFWMGISVGFYFLAVFSKEHALTAPAILMATTFLLYPQINTDKKTLSMAWLSYVIIGTFILLRAKGVFGVAYETSASSLFEQQGIVETTPNLLLLSIFTQAGLFFKYLFLWLVPNPAWLSVDMRETFAASLGDWGNWLKAAAFILYGVAASNLLLRKGKIGLIGFSMLYPWLFFIVEFSTIRIQEPFVLYRSYLWMPGMALLISLFVNTLPNCKQTIIVISIIVLSFIAISWNRLWVFADSYRLWNDAALLLKTESSPGAARIYFNRGKVALDAKRWKDAAADFSRVVAIDPKIEQTYMNRGTAYSALGQYRTAIRDFNQAIILNPAYADAYFGKSMALKHLNSNVEASINIKKSCSLGNKLACFLSPRQP